MHAENNQSDTNKIHNKNNILYKHQLSNLVKCIIFTIIQFFKAACYYSGYATYASDLNNTDAQLHLSYFDGIRGFATFLVYTIYVKSSVFRGDFYEVSAIDIAILFIQLCY